MRITALVLGLVGLLLNAICIITTIPGRAYTALSPPVFTSEAVVPQWVQLGSAIRDNDDIQRRRKVLNLIEPEVSLKEVFPDSTLDEVRKICSEMNEVDKARTCDGILLDPQDKTNVDCNLDALESQNKFTAVDNNRPEPSSSP